jgi:hypothetical protein
MSYQNISRTGCSSTPSLADLLARLQASDLPGRQRQELASAIRTAARALGRSPENTPANGRLLADRLKCVGPTAIGISRGRWNNVRCLLRTALALIQPISPGRNRNDLSPEWLALWSKLASRSDKIALSRVLNFCSARGIGPNAVREGTFDEYRLHLDESLLRTPDETFPIAAGTGFSDGTTFRNRSARTVKRGATGSPGTISWRTRHSDQCGQRPSLIGNGRSAALARPWCAWAAIPQRLCP